MPKWTPEKVWQGQDAYIIGGGKSLDSFDWNLLRGLRTIGCNDAYLHGVEICSVCIFGDINWFNVHREALKKYQGIVFTNCPSLARSNIKWLWTLSRSSTGLHEDALGWNGNTGASALNLALLFGVKRIFLLGFDMHLIGGRSNWHENNLNKPDPNIYSKFLEGFDKVALDWRKKFSDVSIFNITDGSSLNHFPKVPVKEFWKNGISKLSISEVG